MSVLIEVNEDSTLTLAIVVTDANGDAVVPTVATWTLTDRDGVVINTRTDISITPSVAMTVNVAGDDLQILDQTKAREYRLFTVETNRGSVNEPENIQTPFWVKNLKVIT
jgi:hypothetical protein